MLTRVVCGVRSRLGAGRCRRVAAVATAVVASLAFPAATRAADVTKADNADALNLDTSWTSGTAPTAGDVALWDATVTAANTVAAGGNLTWGGIRLTSPGGAVTITNVADNMLTLGGAGIDLSAATQNLTLFNSANTSGSIAVAADQQWSVAAGRTLTLFATSNSANQRLTGSGNITVTGGGLVNMLVGDAGSTTFAAGNGNDTFTGNWTITGGSKVSSLRNGTHGWGRGAITLDNGIMSQNNGNWSFSNNVVVAAGGGTVFSDSSGNGRYMNLTGVISGSGALTFNATAAMTTNEGFILTGSNTFTGPMTIAPNGTVRIGGGATTTTNNTTSGTLGSIDPSVAITNNGILGFGWTDAHTVANTITGTGIVRLGRAGGVLPATQVVTLTAANTYTGTTQVNAGRLNLAGSLTSPIAVASGAAVSGTGSTTGLLTLANGGGLVLAGGSTTTSITVNGATFTGTASGTNQVTFASAPVAGSTYDVVTYGAGPVTGTANLRMTARGTTANTGTKITFTAGEYGAIRTWNTTSGTWNIGTTPNFAEGDQLFYNGDRVTFGDIATSSTVTLVGTLLPGSVTVSNSANTYAFAVGAVGGTTSLVKANAGTLRIGSVQSYTGGTVLDGGTLQLAISAGGTGAIRGTLTANPGTTVQVSGTDVFGYGGGSTAVTIVNLNGATLVQTLNRNESSTAVINMSGGATVAATGGANALFDMYGGSAAVNSTGDVQNTISSPLRLRQNDTAFTVADGAASTDLLVSGAITRDGSGNGTFVKAGAGTMVLSGAVSGSTSVRVTAGTLDMTSGASNYTGGTTLTAGLLSFTSLGTGTVALGGGTLQWRPASAQDISSQLVIADGITAVLDTNGNDVAFASPIGNSSTAGLTKTGAGTLTLSGANTYSGDTRVAAGTLAVASGGSLASPGMTVAGGGTLAGEGTATAVTVLDGGAVAPGTGGIGTLTVSSLVFGTASGDRATVPFGVSVAGGVASTLQVNGPITTAGGTGSVTFAFGNALAQLTTGTYTLIGYTGTQLGSVSAFGYSGTTGARQGVAVANGTQAVNLVISNAFPIWSGTAGSGWSTADNWTLSSSGAPTSFLAGDTVVFNDAGATGTVNLTQNVAPATTTFSSETLDYTVTGSGGFGITAGSLVKSGAGTVTLAAANSFAGGTSLTAGALLLGNDASVGTGPITISGGRLASSSAAALTLANEVTLGGSVALGGEGTGGVTLAGPVGLGGGVRQIDVRSPLTISGTISNGGLTKTGTATLTLAGENAYAGGTTIVNGTLVATSAGALGTGGTVTVNTGDTTGNTALLVRAPVGGAVSSRPIAVAFSSGSTTIGSAAFAAGGEVAFTGGMTIARDVALVGADGGTTRFSGGIGGSGNVTVATSGTGLVMFSSGSSGFAGDLTLADGGRLQLGDGSASAASLVPDTANVTMGAGALLRIAKGGNNETINSLVGSGTIEAVSGADTLTIGSSGGSGSFAGVIRESGGTLAVTKLGAGTQTFTAGNSYSRATTLTEGTLEFTTDNQLGSNLANGNVYTSYGTLVKFGANTLTIGVSGSNTTGFYYGKLEGSGTLRLAGGGDTVVSGSGTAGASTNFQIFMNYDGTPLSPTAFALDTGTSAATAKDFGYKDDAGDVLSLTSLSGYGAIRGDVGGVNGTTVTRLISVDQATDTTFNGALLSHRNTGAAVRAVSFTKSGSGSLTLAGFVGKQTLSSGSGAAPVDLTVTGGLLDVTNPANTTTTNTDAISLGAVTVTSGTLGFATHALLDSTGTRGATAIVMNGGVLRWDAGTTQDVSAGGRLTLVGGQTAAFDTNGNDVTLATPFAGGAAAAAVSKIGGGVLRIAADTAYTGSTSVLAGTLRLDGNHVSSTGGVTVSSGATLAGTGTVGGATTIASGATIAPGASPGTLTFAGDLTWNAGGNYNWQMLSGTGTAGATDAWDLVSVTGTLAIASTSVDPFLVNLWTLSGIGPDVSGSAANFDASQAYAWPIATAAGGISGFDAGKFRVVTSSTNGTGGFANAFGTGTFSIAQSGTALNLVFTPGAPPPVITIDVASGTQTQTQAGYPLLTGSTPVLKTGAGTLVLDQANTLTGSTSVQGGVVRLADAGALGSSRVVPLAGGTLGLTGSLQATVGGLAPNAGGLTDVGSGALTVAAGLSTADMLTALLAGRGDGSWNGTTGITSSQAAADLQASIPRTVGWLDNGDGSVSIAFAAPGDTNLDWQVDILDAANFLAGGKFDSGLPASWIEGDFGYDGIVDILDAADFLSTGLFDAGAYNPPPGSVGGIAAVPEPATWAILAACGAAAVAYERRRRNALRRRGLVA